MTHHNQTKELTTCFLRGVAENLSEVDAYHGMDLCAPIIFFVRIAAEFLEGKIILKKSKAQEEHTT
jgi:hypothetical protein